MATQLFNSLDRPRAEPAKVYEPHATTPAAEYDLHFQYPVFEELRASGVRLVPFIPSVHGRLEYDLWQEAGVTDHVFDFLPYGPFATYDAYLHLVERLRSESGTLYCAVYNTADDPEGEFVGAAALLNTVRSNCSTEIGHIRFHPKAQRTHIATQTIALLLEHAFEVYKCRRVVWMNNSLNKPSHQAALRMGFSEEGLMRWHRNLPFSKAHLFPQMLVPKDSKLGDPEAGVGRHSIQLAIAWDEWRDGVREQVLKLKDREPVRKKV